MRVKTRQFRWQQATILRILLSAGSGLMGFFISPGLHRQPTCDVKYAPRHNILFPHHSALSGCQPEFHITADGAVGSAPISVLTEDCLPLSQKFAHGSENVSYF